MANAAAVDGRVRETAGAVRACREREGGGGGGGKVVEGCFVYPWDGVGCWGSMCMQRKGERGRVRDVESRE